MSVPNDRVAITAGVKTVVTSPADAHQARRPASPRPPTPWRSCSGSGQSSDSVGAMAARSSASHRTPQWGPNRGCLTRSKSVFGTSSPHQRNSDLGRRSPSAHRVRAHFSSLWVPCRQGMGVHYPWPNLGADGTWIEISRGKDGHRLSDLRIFEPTSLRVLQIAAIGGSSRLGRKTTGWPMGSR